MGPQKVSDRPNLVPQKISIQPSKREMVHKVCKLLSAQVLHVNVCGFKPMFLSWASTLLSKIGDRLWKVWSELSFLTQYTGSLVTEQFVTFTECYLTRASDCDVVIT